MNTIKINVVTRTLDMTNAFAKKAAIFGTAEYDMLQKARKDYPNFTPTVKTASKNKTMNKNHGLTYEYMENYFSKIENEQKKAEALAEYRVLRGLDENDEQIAESASYVEIKAWFLKTFNVEDFGKKYDDLKAKREAILKRIAA